MKTFHEPELTNPAFAPSSTQYVPLSQLYYTTAATGTTGATGTTVGVSGQFIFSSQDSSTVSIAISSLNGNIYVLYRPQPQTYFVGLFSDYVRVVGIDMLNHSNLLEPSFTGVILDPQEEGELSTASVKLEVIPESIAKERIVSYVNGHVGCRTGDIIYDLELDPDLVIKCLRELESNKQVRGKDIVTE